MKTLAEAAAARAVGIAQRSHRPKDRRSTPDLDSPRHRVRGAAKFRAGQDLTVVERGGLQVVRVGGYASVTESAYEMYDWWGPYTEVVTAGAFGKTLAAAPLVEFTVNHGAGGGLPMAHTRNQTLDLGEDETGLDFNAFVDPTRSDVADLLKALERGDLAEASFKFWITAGQWSPDYTEFRINEVDIDGGDVSSVNFGANPAASSGLRSKTAGTEKREPAAASDTTADVDAAARVRARARAAAAL